MSLIFKTIPEADSLKKDLRKLQTEVARLLASNVRSLTNKGKAALLKKIRTRKGRKGVDKSGIEYEKILAEDIRGIQKWAKGKQELNSISFTFQRHGVFLQKGVGRGNSIKRGNRKRVAKDWFNTTLNAYEMLFADKIMENYADAVINFTNSKII